MSICGSLPIPIHTSIEIFGGARPGASCGLPNPESSATYIQMLFSSCTTASLGRKRTPSSPETPAFLESFAHRLDIRGGIALVVATCACPSQAWIVKRSTPDWRSFMAKRVSEDVRRYLARRRLSDGRRASFRYPRSGMRARRTGAEPRRFPRKLSLRSRCIDLLGKPDLDPRLIRHVTLAGRDLGLFQQRVRQTQRDRGG